MNADEFADTRTIIYDGVTYQDIPIVLSGLKEQDRNQLVTTSDHAQGLYLVSSVLHCAAADLGGATPEKGQRIKINDEEGGGGFFREFYVASSVCEIGMAPAAVPDYGTNEQYARSILAVPSALRAGSLDQGQQPYCGRAQLQKMTCGRRTSNGEPKRI